MKSILLLAMLTFFSCNIVPSYNKWWVNSIHRGVVIGCYEYGRIITIDSGVIYENTNVQRDIWNKIAMYDTIINK